MNKIVLLICLITPISMAVTPYVVASDTLITNSVGQNSDQVLYKAGYGVYQIVPNLAVIPVNIADPAQIISMHGMEALVKKAAVEHEADSYLLRPNTVLKNMISGEFGVVTGNIMLITTSSSALSQLTNRFNLTLLNNAAGSSLALVKAVDGADMQALVTDIRASGLVKSAELDISEKRYQNQ